VGIPDGTNGPGDADACPKDGRTGAGAVLPASRLAPALALLARQGRRARKPLLVAVSICAVALVLQALQARGDLEAILDRLRLGTVKVYEGGRRVTAGAREPGQMSRTSPVVLTESRPVDKVVTCYAIPIAAYRADSFDKARVLEEVNRLLAQFGLDDLKVVIAREPVVVGGQPFIRAMAGTFRTADEARARCVAVKGVDARRWCEPLALLSSEYPCET